MIRGIQIFKNTAENIRPSQIASDMEAHPNGNLFFQKGRVVAGILGNGFLAINPMIDIKIPPYLKKTKIFRFRHPLH